MNSKYDDFKLFQGYAQVSYCFEKLTKDDILQPFITQTNFITSTVSVANENTIDIG